MNKCESAKYALVGPFYIHFPCSGRHCWHTNYSNFVEICRCTRNNSFISSTIWCTLHYLLFVIRYLMWIYITHIQRMQFIAANRVIRTERKYEKHMKWNVQIFESNIWFEYRVSRIKFVFASSIKDENLHTLYPTAV